MHRSIRTVAILGMAMVGLMACDAIDPHRTPYWTQPGGDPSSIKQYTTNPYAAPDAPPTWGGRPGGTIR